MTGSLQYISRSVFSALRVPHPHSSLCYAVRSIKTLLSVRTIPTLLEIYMRPYKSSHGLAEGCRIPSGDFGRTRSFASLVQVVVRLRCSLCLSRAGRSPLFVALMVAVAVNVPRATGCSACYRQRSRSFRSPSSNCIFRGLLSHSQPSL